MDDTAAHLLTRSLRAAVDQLLEAELTALSGADVLGLICEVETQKRRLAALDHRLIRQAEERGLAGDYAASSVANLLVTTLRVTPGEARARIARARDLGPRRTPPGEPLEPILPTTAAAVRAGEISTEHVAVISRYLDRIPVDIAAAATPVAEKFLVAAASHEHPKALARTAELLLLRVDPDGRAPREDEIDRKRGFSLVKNADGSSKPRGLLTAEVTALWEAIFDSLAAPTPSDDDLPDTRSADQRRHDALGDAATRLMRSDTLPTAGGSPVSIVATTTLAEWEAAEQASGANNTSSSVYRDILNGWAPRGSGSARTAHGDAWSMRTLRLAGCGEATITAMVVNDSGGVLALGRTRRLATKEQRLALAARDGGCCFPDCDRPAAWAEVHHIREWLNLGSTDIDNLCLLCRYHHRHFEGAGWRVRIAADGLPEWTPPAFIDARRRPRRNTAQHLRDFTFDAAGDRALERVPRADDG